ncbi:hypothetical protein [Sulfidibacter corallicola]|uniref:Uncharacterized protein n=1 Tax=Sulfidibacter corallicola TaxID=2818388 RepID=A0A8A4TV97_SULCO|nr:hypothetical protein [Sulfidibacter corallicola]QTD53078.1 hypothetical protein J3U87_11505 [Sulfidibacter corallicola]
MAYRVRYTGSTSIQNVLPVLTPPECAQFGGTSVYNVTYLGRNFPNPVAGPVSTWLSGNEEDFVFNIHMYDNGVVCPSDSEPNLPVDCRRFSLSFTFAGADDPVPATDSANRLLFDNAITDGFQVLDVISETNPAECSLFAQSFFDINVIDRGFSSADVANLENRIFLGVDWNLNINNLPGGGTLDWRQGLDEFEYPIAHRKAYRLWSNLMLGNMENIDPATPIIDLDGLPFEQFALGGTGLFNQVDCDTESFNFFDITDAEVESSTVRNLIGSHTNHLLEVTRDNTRVNFRYAALYLVTPNTCSQSSAFGARPASADFRIASTDFPEPNRVEVVLEVPQAWRDTTNNARVSNDYSITWYYRNDSTLVPAAIVDGGSESSRELEVTLNVPYSAPDQYVIEARITHEDTDAMVSVVSPTHDIDYTGLTGRSFLNAENPTADNFLDPGETLSVPFALENIGADQLDNVTVTLGLVSPLDAELGFGLEVVTRRGAQRADSHQVDMGNLNAGEILDMDLLYRLFYASQTCSDMEFFVNVAYQNGSFRTSHRRTLTVRTNCLIEDTTHSIDGSYESSELFGTPSPCQDSNCTETNCDPDIQDCSPSLGLGWGFLSGKWVGRTDIIGFFWTLRSPAYPVTGNMRIRLQHQATLKFWVAGGILEYRIRDEGQAWSPWNDLILELSDNPTDFYNDRAFLEITDTNLDKIISDRYVFMAQTASQTIDQPVPDGLFSKDQVQFRFTFQQTATGDQGVWQLDEFDFVIEATPDNEFGAVIPDKVIVGACARDIGFTVSGEGNYQYYWYENLDALIAGTPAEGSPTNEPVWTNASSQITESGFVYVEAVDTSSAQDPVRRIYRIDVDLEATLPETLGDMSTDWGDATLDPLNDLNRDDELDVRDFVNYITLTDCDVFR